MAQVREYSEEQITSLTDKICELITDGMSVNKICQMPSMPSRETFYSWLRENKLGSFDKYARAKDIQAELYAEQTIEIADDASNDYIIDDEGNERLNTEHIQRARLRVDTRKWYASKLAPKKFGERTTLAGDVDAPLQITGIKIELVPGVKE